MKKQTLRTLLVALVAMVWVGAAQAQTDYDLEVSGVRVTPANCGDLAAAIPGVEGTVKYDPTTKTLTLQDATIHSTEEGVPGIRTWMDGLNIQLLGKNSIIVENGCGIYNDNYSDLTIKGEGSLVVKGAMTGDKESQVAIKNRGYIIVSGCTIEASAGVSGIADGVWKFDHCTLRAKGGGSEEDGYSGSISWVKPLLYSSAFTSPEGAYWKGFKSGGSTYYTLYCREGDEEKPVTDWVTIAPVYDLVVAGVRVTPANCGDLAAAIPGVEGTVKYDPTTKTLTLQDATIHATEEGAHGIRTWMDGLNIQLLGTNSITAENGYGIFYDNVYYEASSLTIKGEGSLVVKGATTGDKESQYAIVNLHHITVSGCTIEASAGVCGLAGGYWKFDHCTLRAKGGGSDGNKYAGSISWIFGDEPSLWGCAITAPEGAYWKGFENKGSTYYTLFCKEGDEEKPVTDWVTIELAYNLEVAGVRVIPSTTNCDDLASAIPGVEGTVKYDPTTKTLTLQNATIHTTGEGIPGIRTWMGMNIQLLGKNSIIAENGYGISNDGYGALTIKGEGSLVVKGATTGDKESQVAIKNRGSITVSGCTVEASAGESGLAGGVWTFDHCALRAKGGGSEADKYAGSIGYVSRKPGFFGCAITAPEGTSWKDFESEGSTYYTLYCREGDEEKPVTDWVTIEPAYDFKVAGRPVTPANCGDLAAAIPGVEGTVKYDPTTNTLTLQDATIHATEERTPGIRTWIDGLSIQLLGKNVITAENGCGIFNDDVHYDTPSLTIKGEGSLVVKGAMTGKIRYQMGIKNRGRITVSGCTVEASAGVCGLISGYWTFDHCSLRAKGGGSEADKYAGSIAWMWGEEPKFTGCAITSPEGAYWKDFKDGGGTYYTLFCRVGEEEKPLTDWVTIAPAYDLKVAGVQVNSANCEDLASATPNVTGIVKYDPTSKTLTLQDATIEAEGKFAIESGIEGLNVKVVGTSKLISKNYTTLSFAKPSTITGGGTLDVESTTDCAIYANKTSLTIENCTVDARAPLRGIGGFNGASGEILTIRNATVRAEGTGEGSIHGFVNVILEGCAIIEPEGAAFNESLHGVALDGKLVKSKVVITKGGTSIEGVMPNVPQKKRGIYNLEGIRLLGEWKDLPAGIYIVDGEKRIKE